RSRQRSPIQWDRSDMRARSRRVVQDCYRSMPKTTWRQVLSRPAGCPPAATAAQLALRRRRSGVRVPSAPPLISKLYGCALPPQILLGNTGVISGAIGCAPLGHGSPLATESPSRLSRSAFVIRFPCPMPHPLLPDQDEGRRGGQPAGLEG